MKINTRIRYGLRAMIEIATANNSQGILQKDIALNQNISLKYLDNIIHALRIKGLIINAKGQHSGYKLARSPEEISIWDVFTAFEPVTIVDCIDSHEFCEKSCECIARNYWAEFQLEIKHLLKAKTLAQIIGKPQ